MARVWLSVAVPTPFAGVLGLAPGEPCTPSSSHFSLSILEGRPRRCGRQDCFFRPGPGSGRGSTAERTAGAPGGPDGASVGPAAALPLDLQGKQEDSGLPLVGTPRPPFLQPMALTQLLRNVVSCGSHTHLDVEAAKMRAGLWVKAS